MEPLEVQRVRGTNDLIPPESAVLGDVGQRLREHFELYGYQAIDTPLIENLDLFLRKSGEEIAARMYSFTHWNRKLCLRPEFTASVMRAYVNHLQGRALPVRLHYAGPTFRYEKPQRGRYRQFTEVGLECIGGSGPSADAEVLAAACGALRSIGVSDFKLVIGHLGIVLQLLRQLGIAEHGQTLILGNMENLARRRADPTEVLDRILSLMGVGNDEEVEDEPSLLPSLLAEFGSDRAADVAADLLSRANLALDGGSRSPEEIVGRLLTKAGRPDPTDQVRRATDFILRLHTLAGPVPDVFDRLEATLAEHNLDREPLHEIQRALTLLERYRIGLPEVTVDLSLGRGLRYYTGMVFEIYHAGVAGAASQICGGGRYDDLVRALGGREQVPACGFSFGLERVKMALDAEAAERPDRREADALVVPLAPDDEPDAIELAQELRRAGLAVELDVRLRGMKANLRHADRLNVPVLVIYGERERASGRPIVRDMRTRDEIGVDRVDLEVTVRSRL
jgi:ATP phosphoribosyltransferase regulatory subunit